MINWFLNLFQDQSFGAIRSSKWPAVMKNHLEKEPVCAVCKTKGGLLNGLNVHHIRPFHLDPILELDEENLITLCRTHHFLFGHFLNWKSFNEDVKHDAMYWREKIKTRP